ncbi:Molecular chaperone IbpA, HSP20 family [Gracilibacillus ureilyticus]|uniref:Molecular chaperone IbpA, HSP20 family n=1 Tax=Gracilibacillus ureilyticus TaxID=531814 RepID=A0A1H9SYJ3_9BACI|nr:Hsp20/alpha crystallin family protein [Gracilibacillus ureilyticus]SER89453.1 Molecular chaperone IbpA, HSP20 family [Gracilibacillus ureilyticus]
MNNKEDRRKEHLSGWGEDFIRKLDAFLYEKPARNIMETIDQFFDNAKGGYERIPVDIAETDDEWIISFDLPGIKKEQIKLAILGNVITISVTHKEETEQYDQTYHYYRKERKAHNKERTVTLPFTIDRDMAKAKFDNGLLQIKCPKNKQDKNFMSIE